MNNNEINIRDPFVLLHGDTYYLYGTNSQTCWGETVHFDCYTSRDLRDWDGPFEFFHRPKGFFADRCYWAPECYHHILGKYYIVRGKTASRWSVWLFQRLAVIWKQYRCVVSGSMLTPFFW